MKRFLTAIVVVCVLTAADVAIAKPLADSTLPRAAVSSVCVHSATASKRGDTAEATMRPVAGTKKLEIMFLLQDKAIGATAFKLLATAGLGIWQSPLDPPTLGQNPEDVWRIKQPVADLALGYSYRFEVKFLWLGAHARKLRQQTLHTAGCLQKSGGQGQSAGAIAPVALKPTTSGRYS